MTTMSAQPTGTLDPEDVAGLDDFTLHIADRCDVGGCGAQAFYAVFFRTTTEAPLLFCGHHAAKNEPALIASAPHRIVDRRDTINEKPSQSSPL